MIAQHHTSRAYCLISPCRDEAAFIRRTLNSVVAQTVPPTRWVIVDDGSTDETPAILADYAAKHSFIQIVRREDRGRRSVGPGVIDAFYAGYQSIQPCDFEYICKLDVDLDLPPRYFEYLMERMESDARLGTCSGKPYFPDPTNIDKDFSGKLISEAIGDEMSVGMTKFYRVACFRHMGGFVRQVMWDGIDCHRCRMFGWIACSWDEPELRFVHLRPMGSSDKGILKGRMRHGYGQYFMGTTLSFMTASTVYRMTRPPFILGGLAMWWGYVSSMLLGKARYDDAPFRAFLRRYQWRCLLNGKKKAVQELDRYGEQLWHGYATNEITISINQEAQGAK